MKIDLSRDEIAMILSALDSAIEIAIDEEEGEGGAKSRYLGRLERKVRKALLSAEAEADFKDAVEKGAPF